MLIALAQNLLSLAVEDGASVGFHIRDCRRRQNAVIFRFGLIYGFLSCDEVRPILYFDDKIHFCVFPSLEFDPIDVYTVCRASSPGFHQSVNVFVILFVHSIPSVAVNRVKYHYTPPGRSAVEIVLCNHIA